MKRLMVAGVLALLVGAAGAQQVTAQLQDAAGNEVGTAEFTEQDGGVLISVELTGFMDAAGGERAIHLHETGTCTPDSDAAGAHFNPTGNEHGHENPMGPHAGDMPNIVVDAEGNASWEYLNAAVTLDDEPGTSLLAGDGTALIIHRGADDYVTDPAGNAGERIACGVVAADGGSAARVAGPEQNVGVVVPAHVPVTDDLLASLVLPEGFSISIFAEGLDRPRMLAQGPDGTIYVTLENQGDVNALQMDGKARHLRWRRSSTRWTGFTASPSTAGRCTWLPLPPSTPERQPAWSRSS